MPLIEESDRLPICTGCQQVTDRYGDHLLCCKRNNYSNRHSAVQEALATVLTESGQGHSREVRIPDVPDSQCRPADLLLRAWDNGMDTGHGPDYLPRMAGVGKVKHGEKREMAPVPMPQGKGQAWQIRRPLPPRPLVIPRTGVWDMGWGRTRSSKSAPQNLETRRMLAGRRPAGGAAG